jgi:CBS domain-containing protein
MSDTLCQQIMSKNLITVHEHEIVTTVVRLFDENGFHHLPVVNADSTLVGIISRTDVERLKMSASIFKTKTQEEYNQTLFETLLVKFVMTKDPVCLSPEATIQEAYNILRENKFHALPITENGEPRGIITALDLLDHFFNKD